MAFKIGGAKKGPTSVPSGTLRPSFVLGSRPTDLRAPRIKPLALGDPGNRNYGKATNPLQAGTSGFGQTIQGEQ